jgi:hypothetical protein
MTARRRRRVWFPALSAEARRARARARSEAAATAAAARGDRTRAALIRGRQEARDAYLAARDGGVL